MIGMECRLVAGQYHATPWGRHVNEGEIEWPPSPWRVLRTLIATWFRYDVRDRYSEDTLRTVLHALAGDTPVYALPPAVHTHTRHYMPNGAKKQDGRDDTDLVFDAFLRCPRGHVIGIYWPQVELDGDAFRLFADLVRHLPYLGRAESWVVAEPVTAPSPGLEINARPFGDEVAQMWATRADVEAVQLLTPMSETEYAAWRNSAGKRLHPPATLVEALQVTTGELDKRHQNLPAGARWQVYYRPLLTSRVRPPASTAVVHDVWEGANCARYALTSRVKPRLVECLDIAEVLHLALLDRCEEASPHVISGRERDGSVSTRNHQHVFILPEDADGDGRIDHVTLHAIEPFPASVRRAIMTLRHLKTPRWWPGPTREWELYLEGMFNADLEATSGPATPLLARARIWRSMTPYLHPWHVKRGGKMAPQEQIERELRLRGLPAPARISQVDHVISRGTHLPPHAFRRLRHTKRQRLPDMYGSFWEIEFEEPVRGPIALGSNAHFGMGMFVPMRQAARATER